MTTLQTWTTFFGWLTVVNIAIYLITVTALYFMRGFAYRTNARIFRIGEDEVGRTTFKYVGAFKLLITVFCFAPWRDGSTHVVLEPLDFVARLAALVPRPRLNLTRFHGVFAPNLPALTGPVVKLV